MISPSAAFALLDDMYEYVLRTSSLLKGNPLTLEPGIPGQVFSFFFFFPSPYHMPIPPKFLCPGKKGKKAEI